jgi:hypothetical protein
MISAVSDMGEKGPPVIRTGYHLTGHPEPRDDRIADLFRPVCRT